jgi:hypothetical protein
MMHYFSGKFKEYRTARQGRAVLRETGFIAATLD